jgi:hypothetical protein
MTFGSRGQRMAGAACVYNSNMPRSRRDVLRESLFASAMAGAPALAASKLGLPGPYPGQVVAVSHPGSIVSGAFQAQPVADMMRKGMMELTGAPNWTDAWKALFEPGDVVALKVCPVGGRRLCSDPLVLRQVVDGLVSAGVKLNDIVVYNRYRREMYDCGIQRWAPEGVRIAWASEAYSQLQLDMGGYDPGIYMDMALALPGQDTSDDHVRRSYVARLLTKEVNKVVNLPVLKHHDAAGVTVTLKNMSHGFVNNVERSHATRTLLACGTFIPAVVNLPVFRQKVVLHIVDGIKASFNGGPGGRPEFIWEHKTLYFGTDPVALDKTGWKAVDEKRAAEGMVPVAFSKADRFNRFSHPQVEHIELAGILGLGEFDDAKIRVKRFEIA